MEREASTSQSVETGHEEKLGILRGHMQSSLYEAEG